MLRALGERISNRRRSSSHAMREQKRASSNRTRAPSDKSARLVAPFPDLQESASPPHKYLAEDTMSHTSTEVKSSDSPRSTNSWTSALSFGSSNLPDADFAELSKPRLQRLCRNYSTGSGGLTQAKLDELSITGDVVVGAGRSRVTNIVDYQEYNKVHSM